MQDRRSITVDAPPDGRRATPPPRRRPTVVEPSELADAAGQSVVGDLPGPGGQDRAADATRPSPMADRPRPAPAPRPAEPARQRRVVVPAPDPASPPRAAEPDGDRGTVPPPRPPTKQRSGWRGFLPTWKIVLGVLLVLLLLCAGTLWWAHSKFESIETVDLTSVLATDDGTNYLIVGSDTREGVSADDPNAGAIIGGDTVNGPERSDTILVLRVDDDGARMLSVPRDLYVTVSETGEKTRINSAFNGGPTRLISTLDDQLGLPIHHYLEVDFVSFIGVVDAVGGITIDFAHPAYDTHSGLEITEAGPQVLDGTQALAYVRSRFYTEVINGEDVPEGTGDIGRVVRQQTFLAAVMDEIGSERNPFVLKGVADELATGMRIDDDLGFFEALRLLRRMRGLDPEPHSLPTSNYRTPAGAEVLLLDQPGGDAALADFGSEGAHIE